VYGDLPQDLRESIVAEIRETGTIDGLVTAVSTLELWYTTGPTCDWRRVKSFELTGAADGPVNRTVK
jgi:hypothetical protein